MSSSTGRGSAVGEADGVGGAGSSEESPVPRWRSWRRLGLALLASAGLVAGATGAGTSQGVDESRRVGPGVEVEVVNPTGRVRLIAWDRGEVRVTGHLGADVGRLRFDGDEDDVEIEVVAGRRRGLHELGPSDLEIRVPASGSAEIRTLTADVDITGLEGDVEVESASGDVTVTGEPRELEVVSTGGDVRVRGGAGTRELDVYTASGSVVLEVGSREVSASTLSGSIRVLADGIREGSFTSTSGSIEFQGRIVGGSALDFENFSGNVMVLVDEDASARFDVVTYSGGIDNAFGTEARRVGRFTSAAELEFVLGGGAAEVSIETFSGNVVIRDR